MTDNPNAPDKTGNTPIHEAAWKGRTEIVKFLAPLTNNPNAPNKDGMTPIYQAASYGHTEVVKLLASLTYNPNAPNRWGPSKGKTPSSVAKNAEIRRILESFNHVFDDFDLELIDQHLSFQNGK